MRIEVTASTVSGALNAPSSKSAMQRLVAGALLAEGISEISLPSFCDDALAAMDIAEALGAEITRSGYNVKIRGGFRPVKGEIFCGESGLATRMFTPIAALHSGEVIINGKGSILTRPIKMVEGPLAGLGVKVTSNKGYLPVKIQGPLRGGRVIADGSVSSQFITGLLMALPVVGEDSTLIVDKLVSKPYIDLTIRILHQFGIKILNSDYSKFEIEGRQKYSPGKYIVEGDWSGAAFLLVMGAIAGSITVRNLDILSAQADKAIIEVLTIAGAHIVLADNEITVSGGRLKGFEYDISDCPDLAPPLAVLALACNGKSVLNGANRLVSKESDRGIILESTLSAIGGKIIYRGDIIEIEGGKRLKGGSVSGHNDHRIAMALATAGLLCDSPVVIEGMECINKSYPDFVDDLMNLGGDVKIL